MRTSNPELTVEILDSVAVVKSKDWVWEKSGSLYQITPVEGDVLPHHEYISDELYKLCKQFDSIAGRIVD